MAKLSKKTKQYPEYLKEYYQKNKKRLLVQRKKYHYQKNSKAIVNRILKQCSFLDSKSQAKIITTLFSNMVKKEQDKNKLNEYIYNPKIEPCYNLHCSALPVHTRLNRPHLWLNSKYKAKYEKNQKAKG